MGRTRRVFGRPQEVEVRLWLRVEWHRRSDDGGGRRCGPLDSSDGRLLFFAYKRPLVRYSSRRLPPDHYKDAPMHGSAGGGAYFGLRLLVR
jgi:hypothetical protein